MQIMWKKILVPTAIIAATFVVFIVNKAQVEPSQTQSNSTVSETSQCVVANLASQNPIESNTREFQPTKLNKPKSKAEASEKGGLQQRIEDAFLYNFNKIKNPVTGTVAEDMMSEALRQTKQIQLQQQTNRGGIVLDWRERGPNNVGGRTRAIMVDERDPSRKTLFVGSVSGGLWKTKDISVTTPVWEKINDNLENLAVGAIAQDPKNPDIMYMGTGEVYGNLDAVRGVGIFKSVDGGVTWTLLPSTKTNNFRYIQRLVFNPVTNDLFAGTGTGLFRSQDGGATWSTALLSSRIYDMEWSPQGFLYVSSPTSIFRSPTGNPATFVNLSTAANSGFLKNLTRVEFNICKNFPNVIYAVGSVSGIASDVMKSSDGGLTWQTRGKTSSTGGDITNGQAWYDLTICVAPSDTNRVWVGGVPLGRSVNGGLNFSNVNGAMHVDQHVTMFDPKNDNMMYCGNDGGIYRCANPLASSMVFEDKNVGYNTSQFYACALHPDTFSNYILGGTQDNNSLKMNSIGIANAVDVRGGDGMFCHIDQKDPRYQMVCSQFANYSLSTNGGVSFSGGANFIGNFVAPSDYDNNTGIMYSQSNVTDLYEWKVRQGLPPRRLRINGPKFGTIESVLCDPNKAGRIYIGYGSGRIVVCENAVQVDTFINTVGLTVLPGSGTVSSIEVEDGNENHMIVCMSNTGLANSIFESFDRGATWIGVEGTGVSAAQRFPDIPVRWAIFQPGDATKALIATEMGVWYTEKLDGANTLWIAPDPIKGTPLVRTDMLQYRNSDKAILAGTHGRGMWTTDNFSPVVARLDFDKVTYLNTDHPFTNLSSNGKSFEWDFGDGTTSTEENPTHRYDKIGVYPITLKINGTTSISSTLTVLPDRPLPYQNGTPAYGGNFDGFTEQYAVDTKSGTSFERGNSTLAGKSGTKSGSNAFVTGRTETFYQANSDSRLYLPNFNMKSSGIYEFSLWAKHQLHSGTDGFLVEYSLNRGLQWQTLGTAQPGWYNATSIGSSFNNGTPFISNNANGFTKYVLNISSLSGNEDVAFRIVFKSDETGSHAGVAIDDVEISKYDGPLETIVIQQLLKFNSPTELQVDWSTLPEYNCKQFDVELSDNGLDFIILKKVNATGITTANRQNYTLKEVASKCVYFARIKVTNENLVTGYSKVFYTPVMAVKRDEDCGSGIYELFPNPFDQKINITFTELRTGPFKMELFDDIGRLVKSTTVNLNNQPTVEFQVDDLPKAVYLLRTQFGSDTAKTYKLMGGIK